ncbi:MAG: NUDIX hydrolase [Christensenellaceae bacterium]|jgi:ADP-ribose pyrophosphatase|nr:NUDIX hydrolase [Christensenellaceae bacterium]
MDQHRAGEERKLGAQSLYEGRILKLEKWQVELPGGKIASREVVLHGGAAAIVPVDEQSRVALVRQYRSPLSRFALEIPAGKLDFAGEDPLDCAKRELREETGLIAEDWRFLSVFAPAPGYSSERIHLFLARGLHSGPDDMDEDEFIELKWLPLTELLDRMRRGEIEDGKTLAGVLLAARILGA